MIMPVPPLVGDRIVATRRFVLGRPLIEKVPRRPLKDHRSVRHRRELPLHGIAVITYKTWALAFLHP